RRPPPEPWAFPRAPADHTAGAALASSPSAIAPFRRQRGATASKGETACHRRRRNAGHNRGGDQRNRCRATSRWPRRASDAAPVVLVHRPALERSASTLAAL